MNRKSSSIGLKYIVRQLKIRDTYLFTIYFLKIKYLKNDIIYWKNSSIFIVIKINENEAILKSIFLKN